MPERPVTASRHGCDRCCLGVELTLFKNPSTSRKRALRESVGGRIIGRSGASRWSSVHQPVYLGLKRKSLATRSRLRRIIATSSARRRAPPRAAHSSSHLLPPGSRRICAAFAVCAATHHAVTMHPATGTPTAVIFLFQQQHLGQSVRAEPRGQARKGRKNTRRSLQ